MLENSSEFIYCQECASAWPLDDDTRMHYFQSETSVGVAVVAKGDYSSAREIADAGDVMIFCGSCDTQDLDRATKHPHPGIHEDLFFERDSRMIKDRKEGIADGADVVHKPPRTTVT